MRYLDILREKLGRDPSFVELQAFSVMWSEHCGYSHSVGYIRRLPKQGHSGNAGVVELDEDFCLVFKVESHNHPSAIEPYNGAATGVGGIIRDVLAMGARPSAILDSLHMDGVIEGIIEGIADYGNSIGVPTVGGELRLSEFYRYNPLVNVMAVGVAPHSRVLPSKASEPGQVILVFGGATGRDGIHGASFASEDLAGDKASKLSIQVGDPFAEKMLIEGFLRMNEEGLIDGAQDLGAGGVLSATVELVARGGLGAIVHLERLPLREPNMEPWEIFISESQERMAVVTARDRVERIIEIAEDHLLTAAVVAEVTEDPIYRVFYGDEKIMEIPAQLLVNAPEEPVFDYVPKNMPDFQRMDFKVVDAHAVFEQYDYMVGTDTVLPPGFGPAIMRIKRNGSYSLSIHSRADLAVQDPYWGSFISVLESVRKALSVGAETLAITNGVNYGDPDLDPVGLAAVMKALEDACRFADVPVASGNVSLYNTCKGETIPPTLVVGMVGRADPRKVAMPRPSNVYAVGWPDFELERERELWRAIEHLSAKGAFVLAASSLVNITHEEALRRLGLKLEITLPRTDPAHQMVIAFADSVETSVPVKRVGRLSRM